MKIIIPRSLISLILLFPLTAFSGAREDAISTIKALFPALRAQKSPIRTKGCSFQKEKWISIVLTKQEFEEKIRFGPDCDLEGDFTVKVDKFFPINFKLKKFKNYKNILGNIKMSVIFEEMPLLKVEFKDAILKGKQNLFFNMDYGVYIQPLEKNPLKKHKGGQLFIKKYQEKVVNKKFKLLF